MIAFGGGKGEGGGGKKRDVKTVNEMYFFSSILAYCDPSILELGKG